LKNQGCGFDDNDPEYGRFRLVNSPISCAFKVQGQMKYYNYILGLGMFKINITNFSQ